MATVRVSMGWRWRLKMMGWGVATAVGCYLMYPQATNDTAEAFLAFGMLGGAIAVIGGIIGLQDYKL